MCASPAPRKDSWQASMREASPYLGLGIQIALSMVFFVGGGYLLDEWLHTIPWLTVVGALLGMTAIFVQILRVSKTPPSTRKKNPPDAEARRTDGDG